MALEASKPTIQSVGTYDLVQKIAEGGMGAVYRGRHRDTGQIVAIKVVPPGMVLSEVLRKRFINEFRAASKLDHPHIVRALDYGLQDGRPYLVMEFIEGETLGQLLERQGRMPEPEALVLIIQMAQALHHAHKNGLIHRDVKPDNILLSASGQAKLADLGLVKQVDTDMNLTQIGRGLGTPHFMAPEQFRNAKNADVRCDVYSLGATLYQMVTGELPFRSVGPLDAYLKKVQGDLPPPRKVVPELSERVDWAIRRAMSPDPGLRPESCREFIEDLTGHSTRQVSTADGDKPGQDVWYLAYKDDKGQPHTVRGAAAAIRKKFKAGLLGDAGNVRASPSKDGPFEPLRKFAEFRDLVVILPGEKPPAAPAPGPPATPVSQMTPEPPPATVPADQASLPTADADSEELPHIELEVGNSGAREWLKWLLVALLAMAAGLILFLVLKFH